MSSCVIESAVRRWVDTLKHTEERFAVQSTQISAVDAVLSRQRKIIGSVQTELCGLSATQHRMKFQLELLENHQYEIEAALTSLEGDAHELLSCGADSSQLDKNDKLFYFAEGVSVQIKDVCGKIQAIHGTIDDQTSDQEGSNSLSRCVQTLNTQLTRLKSLEGKLAQFSSLKPAETIL
ncbi:Nucleoporin, NSP1-like, C-terminal [Ostreococcus tauri]|uniref:Nucleoporin, NSP1-like, C-terminal n=1 Tax=Ostreococcus tauri TaxID=70448 RepID=Q01F72_OSTTA|nr:Nucleoporin, NSP1-like, C-terminal [Ostreococcus tauri]CAL52029.2 Nucleoporin, NSP1-like, C-terminal [Ostreococcus tauri]|eukprot:XP_003074771.1 Nucleoporin, NSP1-like, C-terminal [Ostreococcus tauri]